MCRMDAVSVSCKEALCTMSSLGGAAFKATVLHGLAYEFKVRTESELHSSWQGEVRAAA